MTLSQIVVWLAEHSQNQQSGRTLRNAGMKRWQLHHLEQLGILSRKAEYSPDADLWYLLDYVKYQPKKKRGERLREAA